MFQYSNFYLLRCDRRIFWSFPMSLNSYLFSIVYYVDDIHHKLWIKYGMRKKNNNNERGRTKKAQRRTRWGKTYSHIQSVKRKSSENKNDSKKSRTTTKTTNLSHLTFELLIVRHLNCLGFSLSEKQTPYNSPIALAKYGFEWQDPI